jgi:hypothetical protein
MALSRTQGTSLSVSGMVRFIYNLDGTAEVSLAIRHFLARKSHTSAQMQVHEKMQKPRPPPVKACQSHITYHLRRKGGGRGTYETQINQDNRNFKEGFGTYALT